MPNFTAVFPDGETMTIYAPNIFDADDEFAALKGDYPETVREDR